jgi:hypothetical protein
MQQSVGRPHTSGRGGRVEGRARQKEVVKKEVRVQQEISISTNNPVSK